MRDEKGEGVDIDLVRRQDLLDLVFQESTVRLLVILAMISGLATWVNVGGDFSFSMFQLLSTTNFWITAGALFYFIGLAIIYLTRGGLMLAGWFMSMLGVVAIWFSPGWFREYPEVRLDPGIGQFVGIICLVALFLIILVVGDFGED